MTCEDYDPEEATMGHEHECPCCGYRYECFCSRPYLVQSTCLGCMEHERSCWTPRYKRPRPQS